MNSEMVVKVEKSLERLRKMPIKISQKGFVINQFFIDKLMYKIELDILNLRDQTKEVYLSVNLNQVYQLELDANKITLYLDNDTEIEISK